MTKKQLPILLTLFFGTGCALALPSEGSDAIRVVPSGPYAITLHFPILGSFEGLAQAESKGDGFSMTGRKDAAKEILGVWQGLLSMGFLSGALGEEGPGDSFFLWESSLPSGESAGGGVLKNPLTSWKTRYWSSDRPVELLNSKEEVVGFLTFRPARTKEFPQSDYAALASAIHAAMEDHLFDSSLLNSDQSSAYFERLEDLASLARDDLEFAMGAFSAASAMPISHLRLLRTADPSMAPRIEALLDSTITDGISWRMESDIAVMRLAHCMVPASRIHKAFEELCARSPRGLILDLRGNPGGTQSALAAAAHLLKESSEVGIIFDRHRREDALEGKWEKFPRVTPDLPFKEAEALLLRNGAGVGLVEPRKPFFAGPVAVLIDRETASAAEPLAAFLQEKKLGTLVGERTKGYMLSSAIYNLPGGWLLQLPACDYLTAQRVRLEGRGVTPDRECPSKEAFEQALRILREERNHQPSTTDR